MKKQLTPEHRVWRDNRDRKVIPMISAIAFMGLGIWMMVDPTDKKHSSVERATTALVKMIWGFETGIVFAVLGLTWLVYGIIQLNKYKKQFPKPY